MGPWWLLWPWWPWQSWWWPWWVYFQKVYFPKVYFPWVNFPRVYFCEMYVCLLSFASLFYPPLWPIFTVSINWFSPLQEVRPKKLIRCMPKVNLISGKQCELFIGNSSNFLIKFHPRILQGIYDTNLQWLLVIYGRDGDWIWGNFPHSKKTSLETKLENLGPNLVNWRHWRRSLWCLSCGYSLPKQTSQTWSCLDFSLKLVSLMWF